MIFRRILIGSAVLLVILLDIWQHTHIVTLGYEIELAQQRYKALQQMHKQLLVEVETLSALDRIEQIAVARLGMTRPQDGQIIMVQTPAPPGASPEPFPGLQVARKAP
ncbi:MAG: cell division protein FtsL [Nitrospirae bacterium]|nr:cell division protein FtsL [Nitrospirota bacterium]